MTRAVRTSGHWLVCLCVCTWWRYFFFFSRSWNERLVWQQVLQVFHHLICAVFVIPAILLLISSLKCQIFNSSYCERQETEEDTALTDHLHLLLKVNICLLVCL